MRQTTIPYFPAGWAGANPINGVQRIPFLLRRKNKLCRLST
jgi:hypothetical protein